MLELVKQLFKRPATNKFPAKYAPKSVSGFLKKVEEGKVKIVPPIEVPKGFRGKIKYDREKCIGCSLCVKVCPTAAIEYLKEKKKIRIYVSRCCFCAQCNDVCPVGALSMSDEFLLSDYDKYSKNLIVE